MQQYRETFESFLSADSDGAPLRGRIQVEVFLPIALPRSVSFRSHEPQHFVKEDE